MDKLTEYGHNYQVKVLNLLIHDNEFITNVYDILHDREMAYFDSDSHVWICNSIIEYYLEYRTLITPDVFKIKLISVKVEKHRIEIFQALKEIYAIDNIADSEYIKTTFLDFLKNQIIKSAILECVDHLNESNYNKIKSVIDTAFERCNLDKKTGKDYKENIDGRYNEEQLMTSKIPTGWPVIDEILDGGLQRGNLGVVIAPTGIGKTWILCHVGAQAIKQGYNVLHYTLELSEDYVMRRYDTILTNISTDALKYDIPKIKSKVNKLNGNLRVIHHPPRTLTFDSLESDIQNKINRYGKFDLVIIDYAELLAYDTSGKERLDIVLSNLYTNLKGRIAGKFNVATWTADQTNRSGTDTEVVRGSSISNGFSKLFIVDLVITLARRIKDKALKRAMVAVEKNRQGPDGMIFPAKFDPTYGIIEFYKERTKNADEVTKVSDANSDMDMLKNVYNTMNKIRTTPNTEDFFN